MQPAAAFAGESLREAHLASTKGCGLLPHDYGADGQGSERRTRRLGNSAPARDAQEGELKAKTDWLRPTAA